MQESSHKEKNSRSYEVALIDLINLIRRTDTAKEHLLYENIILTKKKPALRLASFVYTFCYQTAVFTAANLAYLQDVIRQITQQRHLPRLFP